MKSEELRRKYPKFIYEKFEYEIVNHNLEIKYFFSIPPDHKFTHKITIENCRLKTDDLENLIFHTGLSLIPSYWKLTCSPVIKLGTMHLALSTEQLFFWKKLFLKGMGEYYYQNQIDFTPDDFLKIVNINDSHAGPKKSSIGINQNNKILVPVGGGKDSVVTLELLKTRFEVIPFIINPVPVMLNVCQTAGLKPIIVKSILDPYLLELNQKGYLNGHVPVSAFYSFTSFLAAYLSDIPVIAFSNERSSSEGNTTYLGHEINHQYSKTLEFETDLYEYIGNLKMEIGIFSFLRPLYELQITKLFCRYPRYFKVFTSCNFNFKIDPDIHPEKLWCGHCPKCVSTALMLACFITKEKVEDIMGTYPPDLPENQQILNDLLGKNAVKPFECVLTRAEARAAFSGQGLDEILSSWLDNPNLPEKFSKILKYAVAHP
jgi:hypothetical protein